MNRIFKIFASLCLGAAFLFNIYGCNKSPDPVAIHKPIDSNDSQAASKNCIDSVVGTYYGHTEAHNDAWERGNIVRNEHYSGPGVMIISKVDSNRIMVTATNFIGPTNYFTFDTIGILYSMHGAFLTLLPYSDSVRYDWDYDYRNIESGNKITAKFRGKK